MFELNDATAKVVNFNPRAERHGDENKLAGDLKLVVAVSSSVLDYFQKGLRQALYRKAAQGEQIKNEVQLTLVSPLNASKGDKPVQEDLTAAA